MSGKSKRNWKNGALSWIKLLLKPALLLGSGILLIVAFGMAQRFGWISASTGGSEGPSTVTASPEKVLYICPMMCTPPLSEPGRCPVCGMELVPMAPGDAASDVRSITIDPATRRIANIQTAPVVSKPVSRQIRAVGRLNYDEGRLKTLSAYVDGRIDRLYADYTGVVVNKGDELALLYSPELYTAQSELLAARRASERAPPALYGDALTFDDLPGSARQKLLDLGMTDQQIQQLEKSGKAATRIRLVAPIHGTVIDRLAAEGDYVKTGQPVYRLADLSTIWLMLELFPEDAAAVRYGQRVEAETESLPGETFTGRVAFVDPAVDPKTRTVGVRVVLPNDDGRLKVGEYATARIDAPIGAPGHRDNLIYDPELAGKWISPRHPHVVEDEPGNCRICGIDLVPASQFGFAPAPIPEREHFVVPRNAVLMAGDNSVVYVETEPGRFELRRVTLGPSLGDQIVLLGGVAAGEQVATNGNFLIDSQMQLVGNPSLIDPNKADVSQPSEPLHKDGHGSMAPSPDLPPIGPITVQEQQPSEPNVAFPAPPIAPIHKEASP